MDRHLIGVAVTAGAPIFELAIPCEVFGRQRPGFPDLGYDLRICTPGPVRTGGGFVPGSVVVESEPHAAARTMRAALAVERTFSIVGSLPIEVARCLNARGDYEATLTRGLGARLPTAYDGAYRS